MTENTPSPTKEKLKEEIHELKTRIKNTEYDLTHMFKGNGLLEHKLQISKKTLEDKSKILQDLENSKDKVEEVKEIEQEITEKEAISISSDQEAMIEEEINEEIEK